MLRCNSLLNISSSVVWEACYSCRCHKKALSLSLFLFVSLSLSVCLHCPNSLASAAVGLFCWQSMSYCCYSFNTYIMYFIRMCCQSSSVPLRPITQTFSFFICLFLFIYLALVPSSSVSCLCFFLCWEFNYPGCCFMMLSWHPMTDSLSHLLAWQDSSIRAVLFLQNAFSFRDCVDYVTLHPWSFYIWW